MLWKASDICRFDSHITYKNWPNIEQAVQKIKNLQNQYKKYMVRPYIDFLQVHAFYVAHSFFGRYG